MRQMPNPEEKLKNVALFLCLADKLSQNGIIGDRLKIQKCTFLVTLDQFQKKQKGFNLTFYRYHWGPFSKQLYDVSTFLRSAKLLVGKDLPDAEAGEVFHLTKAGMSVATEICGEILGDPQNAPFVDTILRIGETYRTSTTHKVIEDVYDLEVKPINGPKQKIRDMNEGLDITRVFEPSEALSEIVIPQSWLETLAIMCSTESRRGIAEAEEDLVQGRVYSHAEVWG